VVVGTSSGGVWDLALLVLAITGSYPTPLHVDVATMLTDR
jgi:hypothetical protein